MAWEEYKQSAGGWMKFEEGKEGNVIRIAARPVKYAAHYDEHTKSGGACTGKVCDWCRRGIKGNVQYITQVIDRKDGQAKTCRLTQTVIEQLIGLSLDSDYKFDEVPDYNVKVLKDSGAAPANMYRVIPSPKRVELTEEEVSLLAELDGPEEIIKREIDKELAKRPLAAQAEEVFDAPGESIRKPLGRYHSGIGDKLVNPDSEINVEDIPF